MPDFDDHSDSISSNDIRFQLNGKQVAGDGTDSWPRDQGEVAINFGKLLPMLEEAITSRKMWVKDFADEEIRVSSDLFDVIQAFRYFNNP